MNFDGAVALAMEDLTNIDNLSTSAHQASYHVEQMADLSIDIDGHPYEPSWIEKSAFYTWYWDAISLHCIRLLQSDADISPPLRKWLADVLSTELAGERSRPKAAPNETKGRKEDRSHKDMRIWLAVEKLVTSGLTAMRNDEPPNHHSACDAVAKALAKLGKSPNSYDGVKTIYKREKAFNAASHARFLAAIDAGEYPFD
ncbi:hypothetical protein VE26_04210 [Devosia chinhatensis]|uniref:Uncharacterized protein n=2 Tax=Devosia chinhatensis TaxID=429727 RepID=A0A0F5FK83_9HYPH|nr:hypothetical protein VE26_04210 [Devosia chinhatensis]